MKGKKKEQLYLKQDYDDYHFSLKEFLKYLKMIPVIIYPYIYVVILAVFLMFMNVLPLDYNGTVYYGRLSFL